jgi:hypothetical protein
MNNNDLLHELRMRLGAVGDPDSPEFRDDLDNKVILIKDLQAIFRTLDESLVDGGQYPSDWVTPLNQTQTLKSMPPAPCGHPIAAHNSDKCNSYTCWNSLRRMS